MKKLRLMILPLLLIGLFSVSCKNDDDSTHDNVDVIVGKWKISDVWIDGESVYNNLLLVAYCPLQNEYNFMNDYTLRIDTFEEGGINPENCLTGAPQNGSWSKTDNVYTVTFDDTGETSSSTANFQNNDTFTTETSFEGQNVLLEFSRQ